MRKVLFTILSLSATAATAAPDFKADGYANSFNEKARALKVDTRFALQQCADKTRESCTYRVSEHVAAIIVKRPPGLTAVLIWDGDKGSITDWLLSMGITMAVFSPSVDEDQRAVAMKTLLAGFKSKKKHGEAMLDGEKYGLQVIPGTGLWFSVDPQE
jgi:hypothetical protein